jgi:carbamoyl-phosphate synthase large subunit
LVHPQPDPEVAFLAKYHRQLDAPTFLPQTKTIQACHDKFIAVDKFTSNNIPVAESILITDKRKLRAVFKHMIKKHAKLWIRAIRGAGSKAALPIVAVEHAEFWIDYWAKNKGIGYGDFMLSEYLPGKEFAFQSVWQNGEVLVSQARERQEYIFANLTASGQSSSPTVAMTVRRDDVNDIATRAVKAVDPQATGIFCVDLKENSSGVPCVIEINPGRFFTTSNFFSHAGCNMPDYYVKLALGQKTPKYKPYNNLKQGLYWIRVIDMGYQLIDKDWGIDADLNT